MNTVIFNNVALSETIYVYKFLPTFCTWCIICYIIYEGTNKSFGNVVKLRYLVKTITNPNRILKEITIRLNAYCDML
jgi:hypothetical protein